MDLGWKTLTGAAIVASGAVLRFLGYDELANIVITLGGALGLVGVRHAIAKNNGKE